MGAGKCSEDAQELEHMTGVEVVVVVVIRAYGFK